MPAIPLIVAGASVAGSVYQAKKAGEVANAQKQLVGQQSALANEIAGFAQNQHSMAQPALSKAMQYYMQLATGNRGMINSALAPDRAALTDTYKGAEQGLLARTAPGPGRDRAIAELYRQRAGQLGLMPFQAKQSAIGNLGQIGQNLTSNALDAYGRAGSALTGASQSGANWQRAQSDASDRWGGVVSGSGDLAMGAYDWYRRSRGGQGGMAGLPGGSSGYF